MEVVLAAFAVILVVGLLIPAVPKARYDDLRAQCINNNMQLGLAVTNYASAYQNVLPALTSDLAKTKYGEYNGGIFVTLLPYLEQEILFNNGAMRLPSCTWYAPVPPNTVLPFATDPPGRNAEPLSALAVKVYLCPCDMTIYHGFSENQVDTAAAAASQPFRWAASSYSANYQVFGTENDFGSRTSGNSCGPKYDHAHIPDGSANTVFFGEQLAACGTTAGNLWAYPGIGNYSNSAYKSAPGARAPTGVKNRIVNTPNSTNSNLWMPVFANSNPTYGFTKGGLDGSIFEYNARERDRPPLAAPYAFGQYWDAPPQGYVLPRGECDKSRVQSSHKGCTVTMGDASVRVLGDKLSQATWYAAIMPADGNPLGPDW
jgi:hypothetical protein